ncbi:hypothetical protein [Methyloraptor flagellatus]|jgi:hypothetical protein|uniref:Uncharacterized protein n=1 Tax=Methyloraptor flagellatus TaxID=3162530 RepID=A0AAU7XEZ6_9HYPH
MKSSTQITLLAAGLSVVGAGAMSEIMRGRDACRGISPEMLQRSIPLSPEQLQRVEACEKDRAGHRGSGSSSSRRWWSWSSGSGWSGSSSGSASTAPSSSLSSGGTRAPAGTVSKSGTSTTHVSTGGFGSTGSFHMSGGS